METWVQEWLDHFVRFYRAQNFFEKYAALSDAEFADLLMRWYAAAWAQPLDPSEFVTELRLLSSDETRVWWRDLHANVARGKNVYVTVLQAWSAIARGKFLPDEISETWDSEQGPIALAFLLDDEKVRVYPRPMGDEIDLGILPPINRLIEKTGVEFCAHEVFAETGYVIAVTEKEKIQLELRGWKWEV